MIRPTSQLLRRNGSRSVQACATALVLLGACAPESQPTAPSHAPDAPNAPTAPAVARVTFWTSVSAPLPFRIMAGEQVLGSISLALARSQPPSCGVNSPSAVTVNRPTSGSLELIIRDNYGGGRFATLDPGSGCQLAHLDFVPTLLRVVNLSDGGGRVRSVSGAIDCVFPASGGAPSGSCQAVRDSATPFELTATVASGQSFGGWVDGCPQNPTQTTCTVPALRNPTTVGVYFDRTSVDTIQISPNLQPPEFGGLLLHPITVRSTPTGLQCVLALPNKAEGVCQVAVQKRSQVTLRVETRHNLIANAFEGANLPHDAGPGDRMLCQNENPCTFRSGSPRTRTVRTTVNPVYAPGITRINLKIEGSGSGTIQSTSHPTALRCFRNYPSAQYNGNPGTCVADVPTGATVTLWAARIDSDSYFTHWSGACAHDADTCTFVARGEPVEAIALFSSGLHGTVTIPGTGTNTQPGPYSGAVRNSTTGWNLAVCVRNVPNRKLSQVSWINLPEPFAGLSVKVGKNFFDNYEFQFYNRYVQRIYFRYALSLSQIPSATTGNADILPDHQAIGLGTSGLVAGGTVCARINSARFGSPTAPLY